MASSDNSFNALRAKVTIVSGDRNDVDMGQMRTFRRLLREDEIDNRSPVFHRQAPVLGHFGYFRPKEFVLYEKLSG